MKLDLLKRFYSRQDGINHGIVADFLEVEYKRSLAVSFLSSLMSIVSFSVALTTWASMFAVGSIIMMLIALHQHHLFKYECMLWHTKVIEFAFETFGQIMQSKMLELVREGKIDGLTEDDVIYYYERKSQEPENDSKFDMIGLKLADHIEEWVEKLNRPHMEEVKRRFPGHFED